MAKVDPWQPLPGDNRRVVVIGGGIAGLTAAHELAERGFEVEVIEAEPDPYDSTKPLIGGMAQRHGQHCLSLRISTPSCRTPNRRSSKGSVRTICRRNQ